MIILLFLINESESLWLKKHKVFWWWRRRWRWWWWYIDCDDGYDTDDSCHTVDNWKRHIADEAGDKQNNFDCIDDDDVSNDDIVMIVGVKQLFWLICRL
jgi:hypothetical protein